MKITINEFLAHPDINPVSNTLDDVINFFYSNKLNLEIENNSDEYESILLSFTDSNNSNISIAFELKKEQALQLAQAINILI